MVLIYVLGVLLVVALLQSLLFSRRAFRNLDYDCRFSSGEAMEGEEVSLVETVSNRKLLPLPWLRSEIRTSRFLEYAKSQSYTTDQERFVTGFFLMHSWQRITRRWHIHCCRRGIYPVRQCILLSTDLLGMRSTSHEMHVDTTLTVLPLPADLSAEYVSPQRLSGDVLVRRHYVEDPFYVAGVRAWAPGDPMNRIHWKATAKTGEIMVRSCEHSADENLLVILNMQSSPFETGRAVDQARIETAIRACAGYFQDTLVSGIPVRFAANACLPDRKECVITEEFAGEEHVRDLMRLLAALPDGADISFPNFLNESCSRLSCSELAIVTAYLQPQIVDYARSMQAQGAHARILCIAALDADELPEDVPVFLFQGEERECI